MDDKEGGHAEEAGRTSAQDEVLHAHEGDEDAGGPMTMDGDGEPEDGNEEDVEADEEREHGDGGDDDDLLKSETLAQVEGIVSAAKELFGEKTVSTCNMDSERIQYIDAILMYIAHILDPYTH